MGCLGALLLSACGSGSSSDSASPSAKGVRVCVATNVDGMDSHTFNALSAQGVRTAGGGLQLEISRSPSEYLGNLQKCVSAHPGLVIAVSADMATSVWRAAQLHPSQRFALVDAVPVDDNGQPADLNNVADLLFNEQEPGYLVGALAGLVETNKVGSVTHNVLGILGMNHGPSVDPFIAGYIAGARSVDPNVQLNVQYSDSQDAGFCKQLGINQISAGADILFEVTGHCASGYIDAAYDAGGYAIGSGTDMAYASPAVITSAVKHVDRVVEILVRRLESGQFRGGQQVFSLQDEATGFSTPSSVVPQGIINQVIDIRTKIRSGAIVPPASLPPGV